MVNLKLQLCMQSNIKFIFSKNLQTGVFFFQFILNSQLMIATFKLEENIKMRKRIMFIWIPEL